MKKSLLLLLLMISTLSADKLDILQAYETKEYKKACFEGSTILKDYRGEEDFINTVAQACLEANMIDLLPNPIVMLKETQMGRQNASFYATILFQKKLLYHALVDGIDISSVRTPKVDYILSEIFDKFVAGEYKKSGKVYLIHSGDFDYAMRVVETPRHKKIEIKQSSNNKPVNTFYYW